MLERIHLSIVQQVEQQGSPHRRRRRAQPDRIGAQPQHEEAEQQLGTEVCCVRVAACGWTQAGQYLKLAVANRCFRSWTLERERLRQLSRRASVARCASAWSAIPATSGF